MSSVVPFDRVPHGLGLALAAQGFTELTPIQEAVLDPELEGRDLRLSSTTGSGKTVALGFALAPHVAQPRQGRAPVALVVAPTRELAQQIGRELEWLFAPLRARIAVLTGGMGFGGDFRALSAGPAVVVGTPGRLMDHQGRGSLDLSAIRCVVLDEADEMLDMGFVGDIEALLEATPAERHTHMVSATFPRDVIRLARRFQRNPAHVQGSPAGEANLDIEHVGHRTLGRQRTDVLTNVLLEAGVPRTLVFVRTRVATTELATELRRRGFAAAPLSGEMGQRERNATLEGFRDGSVSVLVATDVAARGLDVEDVSLVVHYDIPENAEVFTHRSGRTGRAGNRGVSLVLSLPGSERRVSAMVRRAGAELEWRDAPSRATVHRGADDRLIAAVESAAPVAADTLALVERLLEAAPADRVIAALLSRSSHRGPCDAVEIDAVPTRRFDAERAPRRGAMSPGPRRDRADFTRFHVTWGAQAGANPSRILAMVCRRGAVTRNEIGAIEIAPHSSVVDVLSEAAAQFARSVEKPDPRNPRVRIRKWEARPRRTDLRHSA